MNHTPTDIELTSLIETADPVPFNVYDLTVGEFLPMILDNGNIVEYAVRHADTTAEAASITKGIIQALEVLFNTLKRWEADTDDLQERAAKGVEFPTFAECVLLDCVEWYGLHSTAEAEKLPVADWFLMKKRHAAQSKFQHNYETLIKKKTK